MKTLSQKLADNLKRYVKDTSKRCKDKNGNCVYDGKNAMTDTPGCFVGALLTPEQRKLADEFGCLGIESLIRIFQEKKH